MLQFSRLSIVMRHREVIFSRSMRVGNSRSGLQHTAPRRSCSTVGAACHCILARTFFEVILSMLVLSAAQVRSSTSHLLGWLPELLQRTSAASRGGYGWAAKTCISPLPAAEQRDCPRLCPFSPQTVGQLEDGQDQKGEGGLGGGPYL